MSRSPQSNTDAALALAGRLVAAWAITFAAVMTYWQVYELAEPGTQYADPLLPCTWLGMFGAGARAMWETRR